MFVGDDHATVRRGGVPEGEAISVRYRCQGSHHRLDGRAAEEPYLENGNEGQLVRDDR